MQCECDDSNCENPNCENREITNAPPQSSMVKVVVYNDMGKGLKAKKDFKKGDFIMVYGGEYIFGEEIERRRLEYREAGLEVSHL